MAEAQRRDKELKKLGLKPNKELAEGSAFTAEETKVFKDVQKKVDAETISSFDDVWRDRLVRGLWTHNKGTAEERMKETIEAFQRIAEWRKKENVDTILKRRLNGMDTVMDHIRVTAGGDDLYGHVVWVEQLVDVAKLCHCGLTTEEILAVRAQATEAMESLKVEASKALGLTRYKQVYILDLSVLALGPLIRRGDVRKLTGEIMGLGTKYYPEGMWRIYIINAPLIFRTVYAIVSPMINPVTRDKIRILGGPKAYLDQLAKNGVPATAVPKLVGGRHPGVDVKTLVERRLAAAAEADKAVATKEEEDKEEEEAAAPAAAPATTAAAPATTAAAPAPPPHKKPAVPPAPASTKAAAPGGPKTNKPPSTAPARAPTRKRLVVPRPQPRPPPPKPFVGPWLCCGAGAVPHEPARPARDPPPPPAAIKKTPAPKKTEEKPPTVAANKPDAPADEKQQPDTSDDNAAEDMKRDDDDDGRAAEIPAPLPTTEEKDDAPRNADEAATDETDETKTDEPPVPEPPVDPVVASASRELEEGAPGADETEDVAEPRALALGAVNPAAYVASVAAALMVYWFVSTT